MNSQANATNYYRRLRRLAALCGEATQSSPRPDARRQLGEILGRSIRGEFESYSDLLLVTLSEERLRIDVNELGRIAQSLLEDDLQDEQLRRLEELGESLYRETAHALSRLRSG